MLLSFNGVIPDPLAEVNQTVDSFWNTGDYDFEQGIVYEVTAPSGKGKTTLLDILFGRRNDFIGQYSIDGKHTGSLTINDWSVIRTHKISYVFQGLRLFKHLTGMENIDLKNKLTNHLQTDEIVELAYKLNIENQLNKKAGLMSFGQQQRLSIIRALAQPFNWLLLDEPFSHIDPETSALAAQIIVEACKKHKAGCIITRLNKEKHITPDTQIIL